MVHELSSECHEAVWFISGVGINGHSLVFLIVNFVLEKRGGSDKLYFEFLQGKKRKNLMLGNPCSCS